MKRHGVAGRPVPSYLLAGSLLALVAALGACASTDPAPGTGSAPPAAAAPQASEPEVAQPWTADFGPPGMLDTERVHLEPLHPRHAAMDHAAFMSSQDHLHRTMHWGSWPSADYTVDQNRGDLARHWNEFQTGKGYAFTVLTPDREACVGCVYLNPAAEPGGPSAEMAYWVVESELATDLDRHLLEAILAWLDSAWPFQTLLLPQHVDNTRGAEIARDLGLEERPNTEKDHRVFVWTRG